MPVKSRPRTVAARMMRERRLPISKVAHALGVSDRHTHNFLKCLYPLTPMQVAALVGLLDCEPSEIVNSRGYLLRAGDL